jgi:hypothetical protein
MVFIGLNPKEVLFMLVEDKVDHQLIKKCQDSILSDIDYKHLNDLSSVVSVKTQKVINNKLIPEIIDSEMKDSDEETKERVRYALTTQINRKIQGLPPFYILKMKVEFTAYERLLIPAFIGAVLFGIIFYYGLGTFFKDALYAPIIGMPFGAALFVYLFSKAIRHPFITKMIKWASVAGLAVITIGAVFTGLKNKLILKPKISFIQWIWLAILTVLTFWTLHLFKPRKVIDAEETKQVLEGQLAILLYEIHAFSQQMIAFLPEKIATEGTEQVDDKTPWISLQQSKKLTPSIQQMKFAENHEAALSSISSFLNSLHAMGIREKEKEHTFQYSHSDIEYFDSFGIINEGDWVEQVYDAWVDDEGRCVFKGKVKKVKK